MSPSTARRNSFSSTRRASSSRAAAWEALDGADALLFIVDAPAYLEGSGAEKASAAARRAAADADAIIAALKARSAKAILVVNKIDMLARPKLLGLVKSLNEQGNFDETFLISALTGDGVADLKRRLAAIAPEGPWMYPEDQLTDISERLTAAEVTREKLTLRLHQELPYDATVETEKWERTKKGELRLEQTIYVAREGQKAIVIGKGGETLKSIGEAARKDLAELLGEPVHLFLHVKVKENWADDPARYRSMGLGIVD